MTRKKRFNITIFWKSLLLILLIAAGAVCFLVYDNYFSDNQPEERENQEQAADEKKENSGEKTGNSAMEEGSDEVDDKKVIQYEGEDPNLGDELSGSITYIGVLDNRITVRVNIDQYLSDGDCTLNLLSNGTVIYSENANIINSASTATCEGFDIPVSNIGIGDFEIMIRLSSENKNGIMKGNVSV